MNSYIQEKMLQKLQERFDVILFYECIRRKLIYAKDYEEKLLNYLEENGNGCLLINIGLYCIKGELDKNKFKRFKGNSIKFDYLIDIDEYNYSKFSIDIISDLNYHGNKVIAENSRAKREIKLFLQNYLKQNKLKESYKSYILDLYFEFYA